ncbi:signal peptidase I [Polycladospora coralii]|uniref:signal peptidase I n=1 Tax=Polycladospora coralii TaxID=2771432 RepID=UPI003D2FD2E7
MSQWARELYTWSSAIVIGIVVALFVSIFLFQPTKVSGHSMEPTLHHQNRIYISKIPRTFSYNPKYGDIVIIDSRVHRDRSFKDDLVDNPFYRLVFGHEENTVWVKRVIGKPGDTIEIRDNQVFRNEQKVNEPYIKEKMTNTPNQTIQVPDNQIFVMGDNRNYSQDSRVIGTIPIDHVLGIKLFD